MAKQNKGAKLHPCFRPFRDYLITMVPIAALSAYVYGWRVVIMLGIASVLAEASDALVALLRGRRFDLSDISSLTFAWIFTLMLPVSVSYTVVIAGVLATVLLGKHAFGGYGGYPFNPAAFGVALTSVSFPQAMFYFPKASTRVPLTWSIDVPLYHSPAYALQQGGVPSVDRTNLLLGDYAGPIGATFCLVAAACIVLLIVHGAMSWHIPATYLAVCALWAFAFPRVPAGRLDSVMLELFCCGIPFAAAYLVAEPTTSPRGSGAKLVFGAAAGVLTMLFCRFGSFENGAVFALLIASPFASWLDRQFAGGRRERLGGKKNG